MKKKIILSLLFIIHLVGFAVVSNLPIDKIEVVNNIEVPAEVILANLKMKKGDTFRTENMLEDFKYLKNLEYFDDVAIQPKSNANGVDVVINVLEKPNIIQILEEKGIMSVRDRESVDKSLIISSVGIQGNKNFTQNEILEMVKVKTGEYFSKNRVEDSQRELLATGYFKEVTPLTNVNGKNLNLTFKVVENPIINNIVVTGNTIFSDDEIINIMQSKSGEVQNYNFMRADREKIVAAYSGKGFTLVNVSDMVLDEKGNLLVPIIEGKVRKIEVKKMVTKQKGNRRNASDDILKTQNYVIDREIEIKPGEIFNNNDYEATVENLMRLGIFKDVKYEARSIPGDPEGIDLILLIDEDRTALLQGALSYGSEVGLMGSLSLKDSNWKGKGQEFGFLFEKSNKDYTGFNIDFFDPWIKGTDRVSWGWGAYKTSQGDGTSNLFNETDVLGLRLNIGKGLTKNVRLSIGTKFEKVKETASSNYVKAGEKWYLNSKPPIQVDGVNDKYYVWSLYPYISYDTRNSYFNPTSGEYIKFQVEGGVAGGYKGGTFGNVTLEARKYHRGFFKNNTFAYRVVGGVMSDSTKESQRFWVGGGNTLRGYDGGFFKGTEKLTATVENRTQINDIVGLVFFADAGRAWKQNGRDPEYIRDNQKFGSNIATTAGVGVRLNTPIGPLRFDFGWPVGNKMDKEGMKFYFNMGQAF